MTTGHSDTTPILDRPAKWAAGLMTDINQQGISQPPAPALSGIPAD